MKFTLLLAASTLAWAVPAIAQSAAADTPATLTSGTQLTVPRDWARSEQAGITILTPPEGAADALAIIAIATAKDAGDAAAQAWRRWRPAGGRPAKNVIPRPPRNGWEERAQIDYEVSPNEHRVIAANALRRGTGWTVALIDMSEAMAEKRGAAIGLISASLRPAGYVRESFAGRTPRRLTPDRVAAMKSFVETSIKELGVPGASFALIDQGTVVYEGGVGVKELGKPGAPDADTLFMVASNTKGMSTLMLATLVDEGKLRWNQPVTEVYPAFRLGSDATTRSVLVKHMVCACTGLPRKDYDWIFGSKRNTPVTVTFDQLATTEPTSKFGEVFQYNNLITSAGGYIGGKLAYPSLETGAAYDRAMADRVFGPLGMTRTTFSMDRAIAGNHASAHGWGAGLAPAVGLQDFNYMIGPYRPAGGAWSSAHDMIKYVQLELTKGVLPNGKRLVSEANLLQRRVHGVPTGENQWYGMGLFDDRTWDVSVVHHGGSMAGYKSDIMLIPDAGIGAVILTNADEGQMMLRPFMRRLLELVYDGKPEAAGDVAGAAARYRAQQAKERELLTWPGDPAVIATLAAAYDNPSLGRVTITRSAVGGRATFAAWGTDFVTKKNADGTVSIVSVDPLMANFPFVVGTKDGKRTLTVRDGQHEYVYTEVAG